MTITISKLDTDITEQMWKVANKKDWGYNE